MNTNYGLSNIDVVSTNPFGLASQEQRLLEYGRKPEKHSKVADVAEIASQTISCIGSGLRRESQSHVDRSEYTVIVDSEQKDEGKEPSGSSRLFGAAVAKPVYGNFSS